jgi:RES domain-containing protein
MPPRFIAALETAPSFSANFPVYRVIDGELVVHEAGFEHLYTSGMPNRYNPKGVQALYAATSDKTAHAEFEHSLRGGGLDPSLADRHQFVIRVSLLRALDLTSDAVRNHLGVTLPQLLETWECKGGKALTQTLGAAVNDGAGNFSAIRYPSAVHPAGVNLVIFHARINPPDFVRPLSPKARKLWP